MQQPLGVALISEVVELCDATFYPQVNRWKVPETGALCPRF